MFDISVSDAMDVIDTWGPDPDLWPTGQRDAIEDLMKSDEEFAEYVEDMARIEAMLENWEDGDDGVHIDEEDLGNQGGNDAQDDDDDEDFDTEGAEAGIPGGIDKKLEEDEDQPIVELSLDDVAGAQDMDGMLADIIRKEIEATKHDAVFHVFTRDYDKVLDMEVPDSTALAEIDKQTAKAVGPLQKDLRRLIAAKSQNKRIPGMRRGRLHGSSLHRILAGDDRVFFRRETAPSLDTAISLVLDCSGSMRGGRMTLATEAAYAIGSVLNRLGIAFECLGFTTAGHDHPDYKEWSSKKYQKEVAVADAVAPIYRYQPISMPKFKEFDERWNPTVQRRFAHVFNKNGHSLGKVNWGGTPEGCANEFAARRLLQRKEARKIMITMTDGEATAEPFSYYNHASGWSQNPGFQRSRSVVKQIEAAGIDLIGIGIQHNAPSLYYNNSMVINSLDEMPAQLLALLKKLLVG